MKESCLRGLMSSQFQKSVAWKLSPHMCDSHASTHSKDFLTQRLHCGRGPENRPGWSCLVQYVCGTSVCRCHPPLVYGSRWESTQTCWLPTGLLRALDMPTLGFRLKSKNTYLYVKLLSPQSYTRTLHKNFSPVHTPICSRKYCYFVISNKEFDAFFDNVDCTYH